MKNIDIIKCLKANKEISDYELVTRSKDSRELFYVLDHVEINRAVKVTKQAIYIYVNNKETTGSSLVNVLVSDDLKSLDKKIKDAVKKAKAAKNKYYPIPSNQESINDKSVKYDLNDIARKIGEAVFKGDIYDDGWLNSTEIFVTQTDEEFLNSKGIHHHTNHFSIEVEVIPTWKGKKEEIELYKFYETSNIDYKKITEEIKELLTNAKLRSEAKTLKDVKIPDDVKVLVKGDMLQNIVWNIKDNLSYSSTFQKTSHYNLKDKVSSNLDLTLKPVVKGCNKSRKYDENGIVLKNIKIISNGIAKKLHGDQRFGYYLNEKNITGNIPVIEIDGERKEYSNEKHLIIENWSSPQLEDATGYWGGEVRLARYFDGEKYIPLTGFSITGDIYKDLLTVELSKENDLMSNYKGPKYFIFKGLGIH